MATAAAKLADERADEKLAQLKADRAQLNITAPADGILYHGAIKDGKWNATSTAKFLFPEGRVPAHTDFLTFIPTDAAHALYSSANQSQRLQLTEKATGTATIEGLGPAKIPVTLISSTAYPDTSGTYPLAFQAELPEGVKPGMESQYQAHLLLQRASPHHPLLRPQRRTRRRPHRSRQTRRWQRRKTPRQTRPQIR